MSNSSDSKIIKLQTKAEVLSEVDVAVVGGGTAGVAAAPGAARA